MAHTPGAAEGCTIFVKLWQFDPDDRTQFRIDMNTDLANARDGIGSKTLHSDARETVRAIALSPNTTLQETPTGGAEILMLLGDAQEGGEALNAGAWLRLPQGSALEITAGDSGAKFWIKTGHLPFAAAPTV